VAEVRGLRGLAAVSAASSPVGIAVPERVDGIIKQAVVTVENPSDIAGHAAEAQIRGALRNRMMDTFADNTFRPDANVTRGDFARLLAFNTPLRQSLQPTPKFTDVAGDLAAIAEAVTAKGSTLRDWDFTVDGMMSASGATFNPAGTAIRLDIAVALVRALGLDAEARAKAGTNVTVTSNGQTLVLADNADIPAALRGYVQIALDKQLLQAFYTLEQGPFDFQPTLKARVKPNDPTTRAFMAFALDNFRKRFVAGN
jgi:serine protease AprX